MKARTVARGALSPVHRDEMYRLFDAHFDGVSRARFDADLSGKNWVILLEEETDGGTVRPRLCGFSTLAVHESRPMGEPVTVVYSGDTIVDPAAWGSPVLPRAWIASVMRFRGFHPKRRCYWLLISSGFRTYRFLPVFFREFWPRHDRPTPPEVRDFTAALAIERFGDLFDGKEGVVRFPAPSALRPPLAKIPIQRLSDPHIAFFVAANPGHARGDELVCLAEIENDNLTAAGRRMAAGPSAR